MKNILLKVLLIVLTISMLCFGISCNNATSETYTITYLNTYGQPNNNHTLFTQTTETFTLYPLQDIEDYKFIKWSDENGNNIDKIEKGTNKNVTLTAIWEKIYNVTYYNTFSCINNNPSSYTKLDNIHVLSNIERIGYLFKGWYEDETYSTKITEINTKSEQDLKIYAKWEIDKQAYGNLPLIIIETQDNILPYDKTNYINCSFTITNCTNEKDNFHVDMKSSYEEEDSVGIRLRGNSTQGFDKKPYRIKFDKKKSILGLKKNKSWVLLADYIDQSAIRNFTAFSLASKFENLDFTPTPNHVVLYLNGEYKGLYLLTEQVDEKEGRVDIESNIISSTQTEFPFLVEMDRNAHLEGETGVDNFHTGYYFPIEIKYPEREDRNIAHTSEDIVFNYIREYMTAVFYTLTNNTTTTVSFRTQPVGFSDLVDVDSFIEYWLINEIMHNNDAIWGNIYMYKKADGKLKFGPVWDFDFSMHSQWPGAPYQTSDIETARELYFLQHPSSLLLSFIKKNENNYKLLCDKWSNIKHNILETCEFLHNYKSTIEYPAKLDAQFWYKEKGDLIFDLHYDYLRLFLLERYAFLNKVLVEENFNQFI